MTAAIFVPKSGNTKIQGKGRVAATYASIKASCPSTCSFKGDSCYAQHGKVAMTVRRLDAGAIDKRPETVAREEKNAIDGAFRGGPVPQDGERGGRDLRLHVSGDARTRRAAEHLGKAADGWKARGGGDVWTYTHAWRTVRRESWGPSVSVLASIENPADTKRASAQGYAVAMVVGKHLSDKAYTVPGSDVKFVPCVQQTRGVLCTTCRLCFDADRLHKANMGIAFAAHGATQKIRKHLTVLGD